MRKKVREQFEGYSVVITGSEYHTTSTPFFAYAFSDQRSVSCVEKNFFRERKKALKFQRDLRAHGFTTRVAKVSVTMKEV